MLFLATWRMKRKKLQRFADRRHLTDDELVLTFDAEAGSPASVIRFLELVEFETDVPRGRLRRGDRFAVELAPKRGWEYDDGVALLPEILQREFGGEASDYDLVLHPTLGDLLDRLPF
ncbi:MAG: hypothetical protein DWQ31_01890 [Planctomycetota bacterium]|nr:MAG: hypothetical protein DWQ31_01890 [Planctomycetota bacterium]